MAKFSKSTEIFSAWSTAEYSPKSKNHVLLRWHWSVIEKRNKESHTILTKRSSCLTFWITALSATNKFAMICSMFSDASTDYSIKFYGLSRESFCVQIKILKKTPLIPMKRNQFTFTPIARKRLSLHKTRLLDGFWLCKIIFILHTSDLRLLRGSVSSLWRIWDSVRAFTSDNGRS